MIQHHLKVAFRNLRKFKTQSIIGILGMTIGLVAFAFGYQWYKYETSFDGFYPESDRMYVVTAIETQTGKVERELPFPLLNALKTEFPEVKGATALYPRFTSGLKSEDIKLGDPEVTFVDENFFDYFKPELICGNENMLKTAEDMVVSNSFAMKYWDSPEAALGKEVKSGYGHTFHITAVVKDFPENSIFHSTDIWEPDRFTREFAKYKAAELIWKQSEITIILCLNESANPEDFNRKIKNYLIDKKYNEDLYLEIIPVTAIRHTLGDSFLIKGIFDLNYIYIFVVTTLILLLCVFVNYTNMYLNTIYGRVREMRLRYAVGAEKKNLITQAITELGVQFILIFILGCCFVEILIPFFSGFLQIKISQAALWRDFLFIWISGFLLILLVLLPLFLYFIRCTALQTSSIGRYAHRSAMLRKSLMVFQVGICVAFIFCALGTGNQIRHLFNKDLGFEKKGLIHFIMTNMERDATVREIEKIPDIQTLTSNGIFTYQNTPSTTNIVEWVDKPVDYKPNFQLIEAEPNFVSTMQLKLIEGRLFDEFEKYGESGNMNVLINETAARIIGNENITGKKIHIFDGSIGRDGTHYTHEVEIIGVVKDFQTASLRNAALPVIIQPRSEHYSGYSYFARVTDGKEEETIQKIKQAFEKKATTDDKAPEIYTMDEILEELHKSDSASFQLFVVLAVLSILISLFGIYSISETSIYRRRKEIAIHKIMGGSIRNVVTMLLKEYIGIALLANLLFLPLTWYFLNGWLNQFPYRAAIGWAEILIIVLITTGFIVVTVLGHILKATSENPAETIKTE